MFAAVELLSLFLLSEPNEEEEREIQETAESLQSETPEINDKREVFSLTPVQALKTKEFYKVP